MRPLTLIVAMTPAGVIAVDGKIPWHVSEDMKRFKRLTTGHAIIMGRKTFDSIGRPLPNRTNIVITRGDIDGLLKTLAPGSGVVVCSSFEDALETAYKCDSDPFVIGGGEIYALAFPLATKLEITYVARQSEYGLGGEKVVLFPGFYPNPWRPNPWHWRCVHSEPATETPNVEFMTFERRPADGPGVS
jgi:dihydrofolate reductase